MLDFYKQLQIEFTKKVDGLLLEACKPYGITLQDILSGCDRVHYISMGDRNHYFIDNEYAFSLIIYSSSGYYPYRYVMDCRVEVIEEMKGKKFEI